MRDLSNPLSDSIFDKEKRKKRKEARKEKKAIRKTEGSRLRQKIRRTINKY